MSADVPDGVATFDTLLQLSPVQDGDLGLLYEWFSDLDELHMWTGIKQPMGYAEFVADIKARTNTSLLMLVRDATCDALIGLFHLHDISLWDGTAAFLLYLAPSSRGVGLGQLAGHEALAHVFRSYPLRKLYADVFEFNRLSSALLTTSGFREEGRLKQHVWWKDRYWDVVKYGIQRDGFEALTTRFLGPWADGQGLEAPSGFGRGEAQRLDVAILTALFTRNAPGVRRNASDDRDEVANDAAWAPAVSDYVNLVSADLERYATEEGFPGLAMWSRQQVRDFLVPSGHAMHECRDGEGTLLAALASRDETYEGQPATRIWSIASNTKASEFDRDQGELRACLDCLTQAQTRGRTRLFLYAQAGTARASRMRHLFGEPRPLPFHGTSLVSVNLSDALDKLRSLNVQSA